MAKRLPRGDRATAEATPLKLGGRAAKVAEEFDIGAKMRALRRARRLTLREVARETGFSPALISQIENNNVSPPIATLAKIARVLRVKVGYFFEEGDAASRFEVVRAGQRRRMGRAVSPLANRTGYHLEALAYSLRNQKLFPLILTMNKDCDPPGKQYTHDGEEFLMVLSGRAEVEIGDERYALDPGDSVYLEASLSHKLLPIGEEEAKVPRSVRGRGMSATCRLRKN
ncbi:MAG: helix-turn-helix domain-containing protein [Myxococcota bacterium]